MLKPPVTPPLAIQFPGSKLQVSGVRHSIVWPQGTNVPAVVAAQFSHTFFCGTLLLNASIHEAFALANHVVQAHCTAIVELSDTSSQYIIPSLPSLYSPIKAVLPDNSSIPMPSIPGVQHSDLGLVTAVPGERKTKRACTCVRPFLRPAAVPCCMRAVLKCAVTMVTIGRDLQPGCLADRLLTGLGQTIVNA